MTDATERVRKAGPEVSRRGFLKGALAGAGLASLGGYEAVAQMVGGPSVRAVRGWGVEPGLVRLSGNENALGPSPRAVEAILDWTYTVNRYGQSQTLLAQLARRHGMPEVDWLSPWAHPEGAWITVGAGSTEILFAVASAYMRDGGELIEVAPGFSIMSGNAHRFGAKPVRVPLTEDYRPDLQAIRRAITADTRVVVITTPGNPSGRLVPMRELKPFIQSVPPDVIVFVDEAYIEFAANEQDRIGAAPLTRDHPNVIVSRTFSKIFGMAGMRVGYAIAQPEVISRLNDNKAGGISVLSSYAAAAALEDHDHIDRSRALAIDGKQYFYQALDDMGLEYVPSESNFILVNTRRDANEIVRKLREEYNVLVGNAQQRWKMQGWLRLTAGLKEENEAFIDALKKALVSS